MSPQPAKVRTILIAKPESRRRRPTALSGRCYQVLWKQQETKLMKCLRLTQSHASLSTTTRASFWSQLSHLKNCTAKIKKIKKGEIHPKSRDSVKLPLTGSGWRKKKMPGWKRQETKDVSPTGESTYKNVSEARESKMPGGSCDRKLSSRSLKATRVEIDQIFRVGPTPCPLPPPLPEPWFQLPALEICPARLNKDQSSSSIEQRLYLAASRWAMANEEEENVRLEEAGKKKDASATSESTYNASSGARESKMPGGSSVSSLEPRSLEGNKKWNRSGIQGWLNLMPHCPPPPQLELWFQPSALESCIAECNKKIGQAHL